MPGASDVCLLTATLADPAHAPGTEAQQMKARGDLSCRPPLSGLVRAVRAFADVNPSVNTKGYRRTYTLANCDGDSIASLLYGGSIERQMHAHEAYE